MFRPVIDGEKMLVWLNPMDIAFLRKGGNEMIDREKVINELKEGIDFAIHRCHCGLGVTMEMALALLEVREPFEPTLALNDGEHELWQCGNCKVAIFPRYTKYCHNCGMAVKWDATN